MTLKLGKNQMSLEKRLYKISLTSTKTDQLRLGWVDQLGPDVAKMFCQNVECAKGGEVGGNNETKNEEIMTLGQNKSNSLPV